MCTQNAAKSTTLVVRIVSCFSYSVLCKNRMLVWDLEPVLSSSSFSRFPYSPFLWWVGMFTSIFFWLFWFSLPPHIFLEEQPPFSEISGRECLQFLPWTCSPSFFFWSSISPICMVTWLTLVTLSQWDVMTNWQILQQNWRRLVCGQEFLRCSHTCHGACKGATVLKRTMKNNPIGAHLVLIG